MHNLLKQGKKILNIGDLLVCDEDERVVDNSFHLVGVCYHVGGDVASVKLHALNNLSLCQSYLGLLNSDNAVGGNLLHSIGDNLADFLVSGGDGGDSCDVSAAVYGF